MSMTNGVSFFDKSLCLFKDGAIATASTNPAAENLVLGSSKYYRWESAGSDDTTTETLVIIFPEAVSISRIFILGHNLKDFEITSTDGAFLNVASLDATGATGIEEAVFSRETAYYEFTPLETDNLTLTMRKTQVADEEKHVTQIIATNEIGTLRGFPNITDVGLNRNLVSDKTITGKYVIEKGHEVADFSMALNSYPHQEDLDILDGLHDRENPFLVWLCGGKPDNFRLKQRGWRLGDLYQMQVSGSSNNGYEKNVYKLGAKARYSFREVA